MAVGVFLTETSWTNTTLDRDPLDRAPPGQRPQTETPSDRDPANRNPFLGTESQTGVKTFVAGGKKSET